MNSIVYPMAVGVPSSRGGGSLFGIGTSRNITYPYGRAPGGNWTDQNDLGHNTGPKKKRLHWAGGQRWHKKRERPGAKEFPKDSFGFKGECP